MWENIEYYLPIKEIQVKIGLKFHFSTVREAIFVKMKNSKCLRGL